MILVSKEGETRKINSWIMGYRETWWYSEQKNSSGDNEEYA